MSVTIAGNSQANKSVACYRLHKWVYVHISLGVCSMESLLATGARPYCVTHVSEVDGWNHPHAWNIGKGTIDIVARYTVEYYRKAVQPTM